MIFSEKVHFIAGKGGVGKTTCSKALATYFANNQYKTLYVSLAQEEQSKGAICGSHLHYLNILSPQAMYEYLQQKIPERLIDLLLSNKLLKAAALAFPGLSDLTCLGKIWFHADDANKDKAEVFDKLVVDMPSSGFVSRFLSIASVVSQAIKLGPVAKEAKIMSDFFKNNARVHLITIPEELAVTEVIELYQELEYKKDVPLGYLFINLMAKYSLINIDEMLAFVKEQDLMLLAMLNDYKQRLKFEATQVAKLTQKIKKMPFIKIDECSYAEDEQPIIAHIIKKLELSHAN